MERKTPYNQIVKSVGCIEEICPDGRIVRRIDASKLDALAALSYREISDDLYDDNWTAAVQLADEIYIRVAADHLTSDAGVTLKSIIRRRGVNYIRVAVDSQWRRTIIEGIVSHAIEADLSKILLAADTAVWGDYYARDLDPNGTSRHPALAATTELWANRHPKWTAHSLCSTLEERGFNRFVLSEFVPDLWDFRIVHAGTGLCDAKSGWFRAAVGKPISRMPDNAYANAVIDDYAKPVATWLPRLQRVASRVYWGNRKCVDRDYMRLALPIGSATHTGPLLLTITADFNPLGTA